MQDAQEGQSIAGVFTPRLVARLHLTAFDGSLRFSASGATRVIYFRRGEIASAASNADADRLPNILIGDGRLTEPQLEMARSRLRPGVSLGKVLIELGFLTPSELLQGARRQVRQILAACFGLTEGTYQVNPGPLPPEITVLGLPIRRLVFDALMETGDRQAIVREMGSMESIYHPTAALVEGLASLKLDPSTEQVALAVDGQRTLREISSRTSLDDFTVSRVVLALEILGLAESKRQVPQASLTSEGRRIPVESETHGEEASRPSRPAEESEKVPDVPAAAEPPVSTVAAVAPGAPEEPAEELPLPPPPGELPAFAVPPGAALEWRLDPETGEKSLAGPVEMTFDGPLAPPSGKPSTARRWGAAAAVAAVVLAAALVASLVRSRQTGEPDSAPEPARAAPQPRTEPEAPGTAEAGVGTLGPAEEPIKESGTAPSARPSPEAEPTAEPPSATPPGDERITGALRLIEEGRVAEAAETFRGLVREGRPDRFTLQVMIACEPATVQKALAATRSEGALIVVPFPLQGRACYRACWGIFPSKEAAHAAVSSLPAYFAEAARQPVVVSFARLAPPS